MTRALAGLGAAALLTLVLAACSAPTPTGGDPGPGSGDSPATDGGSGSVDVSGIPSGCDLVTPELISSALGLQTGAGESSPSSVDGPDSCHFEDLSIDVQVTSDAELYFPDSVYSPGSYPDAIPVTGADRGFGAQSIALVVKGDTGVLVTMVSFSVEAPDAAAFEKLGEAILAKL